MNQSIPPVPQTGRHAPPLPSNEVSRLLSRRHKEDLLDLFANDPDPEIRQLGRLALRRNSHEVEDAFALGDLCAQRVLLDDQLRVFYVGKALSAYRRAGPGRKMTWTAVWPIRRWSVCPLGGGSRAAAAECPQCGGGAVGCGGDRTRSIRVKRFRNC
jgi:hypothetical protein